MLEFRNSVGKIKIGARDKTPLVTKDNLSLRLQKRAPLSPNLIKRSLMAQVGLEPVTFILLARYSNQNSLTFMVLESNHHWLLEMISPLDYNK